MPDDFHMTFLLSSKTGEKNAISFLEAFLPQNPLIFGNLDTAKPNSPSTKQRIHHALESILSFTQCPSVLIKLDNLGFESVVQQNLMANFKDFAVCNEDLNTFAKF